MLTFLELSCRYLQFLNKNKFSDMWNVERLSSSCEIVRSAGDGETLTPGVKCNLAVALL